MSYKSYTKEEFCTAVKESFSIAEVCRKLGLKEAGGNHNTVHKKVAEYQLDTSHFTGQLWSKGKQLKDFSGYNNPKSLKRNLILIRGHKCESCNLFLWLNSPIPLELHHIDGDRWNNKEENLQLLCPNCHALTDNYRRRKDGGLAERKTQLI